ncbi:MAG: ribosome silencing factor [Pseudomonadota bacterium]
MPQHSGTAATGERSAADTLSSLGAPSANGALYDIVAACLDDAKAEDVVTIDLHGKTSIGDHMVIASGRSERHVGAIADQLARKLKEAGHGRVRVEGLSTCDWVLVDIGDIIVHVFRPEVREFYNLEKMWQAPPLDAGANDDTPPDAG